MERQYLDGLPISDIAALVLLGKTQEAKKVTFFAPVILGGHAA
jgi:hypothetical protein